MWAELAGRTSSRVVVSAVFVFGLALALRLWGIGFGLPELYHPDEPAYVLQALAVARGLPNRLTFADPPLFKYVLLLEYAATYGVQRLSGTSHSPQEFVDQFRADPSTLYLIARSTSAVLGAATALAAGVLAAEVSSARAGWIAAVGTAVGYLLVRESHFGVNDALVTLLVTLGLIFCVRICHLGARRTYLLAGALAGLAFAAKYYGIALLVPMVLAHFSTSNSRSRQRDLVLAFVACAVAAIVAFPSLLTEPARVVQDIYLHLYLSAVGGYDGLDPDGGYLFYLRALGTGLGWPLLILSIAGLVLSALRKDRAGLIVAALPLAMLLVLGSQRLYFARFALPSTPALVVEASVALDALVSVRPAIALVTALVALAPTTVDTIRFDSLLSQTDTRTLARDWIDTSLPTGAVIAVDSPPLGPPTSNTAGHQALIANDFSLFDLALSDYHARGVDYIVLSSYTSEARAIDAERDARRRAFNEALRADSAQVVQFKPFVGEAAPLFHYDQIYAPFDALDRLVAPGPTLTVYRLTR